MSADVSHAQASALCVLTTKWQDVSDLFSRPSHQTLLALERKGLADRYQGTPSQRVRWWRLTPKGRNLASWYGDQAAVNKENPF